MEDKLCDMIAKVKGNLPEKKRFRVYGDLGERRLIIYVDLRPRCYKLTEDTRLTESEKKTIKEMTFISDYKENEDLLTLFVNC